jgi:hypothetical protein
MAPGSSLPTFPSWLTYDIANMAFKGSAPSIINLPILYVADDGLGGTASATFTI